jgi:DNA replication protein DnaC
MNTNWQELKREFQQRREKAIIERDIKKETVYKEIPEIKEIDKKIKELGISASFNAIRQKLDGGSLTAFESELNQLLDRKKQLLTSHGYPEDYLEIVYTCSNCNDTGFVIDSEGKPGVEPCHCYRQLLVERFYDVSNLNSDSRTGFEFFNVHYYSDIPNEDNITPHEQALRVRKKCLDFVNHFEEKDCLNLYFTGPTGVGKTFLSKCIALEILKKGHTVLYLPAPAMFDIIYRSKYQFDGAEEQNNAYNYILNAELLIIDDLGTESPSAAKYTELLTLLNYRSARNTKLPCKTILSTNIEPKDLHKIYSERVESRILGEFDILYLFGDDIRLVKRFQQSK